MEMIKSIKKPGCFLSVIVIVMVIIALLTFQVLANSFVYFILTWPIWLGKAFEMTLEFAQKSLFNKLILMLLFILLAAILYRLKKRALLIFGVIELIGGVFIIWGSIVTPSDNYLTNSIGLAAGLFLIIQGYENYSFASEEYNTEKTNNDEMKIDQ